MLSHRHTPLQMGDFPRNKTSLHSVSRVALGIVLITMVNSILSLSLGLEVLVVGVTAKRQCLHWKILLVCRSTLEEISENSTFCNPLSSLSPIKQNLFAPLYRWEKAIEGDKERQMSHENYKMAEK